jgi:hypothetical protein
MKSLNCMDQRETLALLGAIPERRSALESQWRRGFFFTKTTHIDSLLGIIRALAMHLSNEPASVSTRTFSKIWLCRADEYPIHEQENCCYRSAPYACLDQPKIE